MNRRRSQFFCRYRVDSKQNGCRHRRNSDSGEILRHHRAGHHYEAKCSRKDAMKVPKFRARTHRTHFTWARAMRKPRLLQNLSKLEGRAKDYARLLRDATPWDRRAMEGWRDFRRGVAWVMLYAGVPAKQTVFEHGLIDECPYHVAKCHVVSMDPGLVLKHRRTKRQEYWYLEDRSGKHKWSKRGPREKVQTAYRFKGQKARGRRQRETQ